MTVDNPKELYIFVYPSGQKTFSIKLITDISN